MRIWRKNDWVVCSTGAGEVFIIHKQVKQPYWNVYFQYTLKAIFFILTNWKVAVLLSNSVSDPDLIRSVDPDSNSDIRIRNPDPDPRGRNDPQKF